MRQLYKMTYSLHGKPQTKHQPFTKSEEENQEELYDLDNVVNAALDFIENKKQRDENDIKVEIISNWRSTLRLNPIEQKSHQCTEICTENIVLISKIYNIFGCRINGTIHICDGNDTCPITYDTQDGLIWCVFSRKCVSKAIQSDADRFIRGVKYNDISICSMDSLEQPEIDSSELNSSTTFSGSSKSGKHAKSKGTETVLFDGELYSNKSDCKSDLQSKKSNFNNFNNSNDSNVRMLAQLIKIIFHDLINNKQVKSEIYKQRRVQYEKRAFRDISSYVRECISLTPPVLPNRLTIECIYYTSISQCGYNNVNSNETGGVNPYLPICPENIENKYARLMTRIFEFIYNKKQNIVDWKANSSFLEYILGFLYYISKSSITIHNIIICNIDWWIKLHLPSLKDLSQYKYKTTSARRQNYHKTDVTRGIQRIKDIFNSINQNEVSEFIEFITEPI